MDNTAMTDMFATEISTDISQDVSNTSTPTHRLSPYFNMSKTAETEGLSLANLWLYYTLRIIWAALAIFGNSLTMFAVKKFERLQTCTNYLICSLAVSDLLSVLVVPLMMVAELHPAWFFIPTCLLEKSFSIISSAGNMLSILYLSIDRYIYIDFPLRYHDLVTTQRTVTLLSVTWCLCLVTVPTLVFIGNHLQVGMRCTYHIFLDAWVNNLYLYPQFLVVVTLTIGFNLAIARIAHNQARRIQVQQQPYNTLDVAVSQSTKKISRTLGTVLGVYLFSIMPQAVIVNYSMEHPLPLERFTILLYWSNTWVNTLIYAWRLKDFKIAFKKIFTGRGSFIDVPGMPT